MAQPTVEDQLDQVAAAIAGCFDALADRLTRIDTQLDRLERKLDRVLAAVDEETAEACPHCGNTEDIEDTSVMGEPTRKTCPECGNSWRPDEQQQA